VAKKNVPPPPTRPKYFIRVAHSIIVLFLDTIQLKWVSKRRLNAPVELILRSAAKGLKFHSDATHCEAWETSLSVDFLKIEFGSAVSRVDAAPFVTTIRVATQSKNYTVYVCERQRESSLQSRSKSHVTTDDQ
jgi:hypothetical protein